MCSVGPDSDYSDAMLAIRIVRRNNGRDIYKAGVVSPSNSSVIVWVLVTNPLSELAKLGGPSQALIR